MCQPDAVSSAVSAPPVCVLGLGLIGGSLLRAAVAAGREAWGYNRSSGAVDAAIADGFDASTDLPAVLRRAAASDALVVVAVPMPAVDSVLAAVRSHFKPEFLNRLDDIVVFHALSPADLTSIVDIQVDRLGHRLAERRLHLEVTDAARTWLASHGYDPVYGARPLRRLVQTAIGDRLARALLAGEIRDGDTVRVDRSGAADELTVARA